MAKIELTEAQKEIRRRNLEKARAARRAEPATLDLTEGHSETIETPVAPAPAEEALPVAGPDDPDVLELSGPELERIRAEAQKKVDAELAEVNRLKKKELMAKMLDQEIQRQRREAGLTDYRDDLVEILIDVAPFTDGITLDGTVYQHERWYTVDRRKFDVLREIMARSWDSEDRAGNPNRKFRRTVAGSTNPMLNERTLSDGSFTLGQPTRVNGSTGAVSGAPSVGA